MLPRQVPFPYGQQQLQGSEMDADIGEQQAYAPYNERLAAQEPANLPQMFGDEPMFPGGIARRGLPKPPPATIQNLFAPRTKPEELWIQAQQNDTEAAKLRANRASRWEEPIRNRPVHFPRLDQ